MRLADAAIKSFARHETFHPRYGWFRKAYSVAAADPDAFRRPDAPVTLGVGKNMVRAIRFWGLAAKLITENPQSPNKRAPQIVPTRRGHALFGQSGWDPYMEDPGTLWLLHWLLLAPPSRLPVWWVGFNEFGAVEFGEPQLLQAVTRQLEATSGWAKPSNTSVKKDVKALLRTYGPAQHSRRVSIDDSLDCPLRELGLLRLSSATGLWRFSLGDKPTLPAAIALHVTLDYVDRTVGGANTITLDRLATEIGSPGRAFKLSDADLLELLQLVESDHDSLSLSAAAGVWQLSWRGDPAEIATTVLDDYYAAGGGSGRRQEKNSSGCVGDTVVDLDLFEGRFHVRPRGEHLHRTSSASGGTA